MRAAEKAAGRAPIDAFHAELAAAWGDPDTTRRVRWLLSPVSVESSEDEHRRSKAQTDVALRLIARIHQFRQSIALNLKHNRI